jgi:hypothetical protein
MAVTPPLSAELPPSVGLNPGLELLEQLADATSTTAHAGSQIMEEDMLSLFPWYGPPAAASKCGGRE